MRILLIVPAHNEEENLPALLKEIKNRGYDAVVVDDASTDGSADAARVACVPVLSLPVNLGIGGGVQTGFLYAVRNHYDIAVQVDGDGQHSTEWLPAILAPILADEADCVVGSRYVPECPDDDYKTPFVRRAGMYFSTGILALFTGIRIHDTTSGFRALNRRAFTFFSTDYPVDHPEAESLLLLHQLGFRIKEVPVKMRCRTAGQSLFTMTRAALYPLRVVIGFAGLVFKKPMRKKI
jgi:glycosyltransferase involved in cell wall biosynthesis